MNFWRGMTIITCEKEFLERNIWVRRFLGSKMQFSDFFSIIGNISSFSFFDFFAFLKKTFSYLLSSHLFIIKLTFEPLPTSIIVSPSYCKKARKLIVEFFYGVNYQGDKLRNEKLERYDHHHGVKGIFRKKNILVQRFLGSNVYFSDVSNYGKCLFLQIFRFFTLSQNHFFCLLVSRLFIVKQVFEPLLTFIVVLPSYCKKSS